MSNMETSGDAVEPPTVYDIVGARFFDELVDHFYDGVETDPVLMRLYPEGSDTAAARRRLAMFLCQYWGGPHDYMEERGHPRLRMRHAPFPVGPLERDRWLAHMASAIEKSAPEIPDAHRDEIIEMIASYMVNAAEHLRNTD
ncbi:MAG: globin [Ilumatobacteraceae bacterium]